MITDMKSGITLCENKYFPCFILSFVDEINFLKTNTDLFDQFLFYIALLGSYNVSFQLPFIDSFYSNTNCP